MDTSLKSVYHPFSLYSEVFFRADRKMQGILVVCRLLIVLAVRWI